MEVHRRHDTAVVLHLYYPELWTRLRSHLDRLDTPFDLFVTISDDVEISEEAIRLSFPGAQTFRCENRGRDIAPFLRVYSAIADIGYKYVCKVHTKKSPHIVDGQAWHEDMLGKLLGSATTVAQVKAAFDTHPDWGLIAPQGHLLPLDRDSLYWGNNEAMVLALARDTGIPASAVADLELSFAAGSMFWFRPQALRRLLDAGLRTEDFEPELGQLDGTLAHAVERFFCLAAAHSGFKVAEVDARGPRLPDMPFQFRLVLRQAQGLARQVQALSAQVAEKDQRLHDLSRRLGELGSELAATQHQVAALLSSASWRWMAPLRAIKRMLMRAQR